MGKYLTCHIKEISQVISPPYTRGNTMTAFGNHQFNLGVIFLFVGNAHISLYPTQSNSDMLFIIQSKFLSAE